MRTRIIMDIKNYGIVPAWVFSNLSSWLEYYFGDPDAEDHRYYREIQEFFQNSRSKVLIIEDSKNKFQACNQSYSEDLAEMAKEYGIEVIKCDSEEACEYYLAKAKAEASQYKEVTNPFIPLFASMDL
jgi:hypothetical protein